MLMWAVAGKPGQFDRITLKLGERTSRHFIKGSKERLQRVRVPPKARDDFSGRSLSNLSAELRDEQ